MATRKIAIENIKYQVAKYGRVTMEAMRYYIEHRISYEAFQEAVKIGMRKYEALKNKQAEEDAKAAADAQDPNFN